jgi:enamine deaminase RidA (YjgF/YER057c/UK114 family)
MAPIAAPLEAQTRTAQTVLMSTNAQARADQERYGYASAVIAGDTIYLSGMVAGRHPAKRASWRRSSGSTARRMQC